MFLKMSVKFPIMNFDENPFSDFRGGTCGRTDRRTKINRLIFATFRCERAKNELTSKSATFPQQMVEAL
jgi:hypothetical protein